MREFIKENKVTLNIMERWDLTQSQIGLLNHWKSLVSKGKT